MLSFRKAAQFSQDRGGYFCVLLLSLPKEYPNPKQVKPKLTTAIKSTILIRTNKNIPVIEIIPKLLLVTEAQFAEVMNTYKEKLKNEEFRQNFDVFRLPIFRNEAKMLEKILIRGNEDSVWNVRDPHMRAHSYIFAMFGLAETTATNPACK